MFRSSLEETVRQGPLLVPFRSEGTERRQRRRQSVECQVLSVECEGEGTGTTDERILLPLNRRTTTDRSTDRKEDRGRTKTGV